MKSSRHHWCHTNANISIQYIQYICDFLSFRLQILKQRLLKRLKHQKPQLQVWPDQHPRYWMRRKKELLEAQPNFPRRQCWQHRMNLNRLRHSHDSTVGDGDSIRFDGIIFRKYNFSWFVKGCRLLLLLHLLQIPFLWRCRSFLQGSFVDLVVIGMLLLIKCLKWRGGWLRFHKVQNNSWLHNSF